MTRAGRLAQGLVAVATACLLAVLGLAGPASAGADTSGGFVLDRGRYQSIDLPGAEVPGAVGVSVLTGVNNRGQIAGTVVEPDLTTAHGFLFADGVGRPATTINVPGAANIPPSGSTTADASSASSTCAREPCRARAAQRAAATPLLNALPLALGQ